MSTDDARMPYLEVVSEDDEASHRIEIPSLPFKIGRGPGVDFQIHSRRVSKEHAEIDRRGSRFYVRDLGSRNGTFVNGDRVTVRRRIRDGDVLHVAHRELFFRYSNVAEENLSRTLAGSTDVPIQALRELRDLHRILEARGIRAVFQQIVDLRDQSVFGYEGLARTAPDAPRYNPAELLRIAKSRGKAKILARTMREVMLDETLNLPQGPSRIFMNVHPEEMNDLISVFTEVPELLGRDRTGVVEVHESAVTDLTLMATLRDQLKELGVELAYDDFGAGQSRLRELTEVPPDYIKLDMALIRDIDKSEPRQELVRALTKVMTDLGIRIVAEGIETKEELDICLALGCDFGQGYYLHRPSPAEEVPR